MDNFIVVDVEADGPCPGLYSMISFGAVAWNGSRFYGECSPISNDWIPEALAISNITREQHLTYQTPATTMKQFHSWLLLKGHDRLTFWSDNPAFDWQFINYYFHLHGLTNPFGFSARRIGDFYAGTKNNVYKANEWKKLRKTKHTHNPVDDAMGNMEALKTIMYQD